MAEVVDAVKALASTSSFPPLVLIRAGGDTWTLPLLQLRSVRGISAPKLEPSILKTMTEGHRQPFYLLDLNRAPMPALAPRLELIQTFAERDSCLYRIRPEVSISISP